MVIFMVSSFPASSSRQYPAPKILILFERYVNLTICEFRLTAPVSRPFSEAQIPLVAAGDG
jgi:hypothetical protein